MWYLAELLLGLPDANHLRGVGDDGGRRPSGHVVRMAVFVLWRRARRSNHEAGNKNPSHAAKTRRSRDCTAPSSSGCEPGTGSWTWRCPPWPSSWPSCWAGRPGGGQSKTSSGGGGGHNEAPWRYLCERPTEGQTRSGGLWRIPHATPGAATGSGAAWTFYSGHCVVREVSIQNNTTQKVFTSGSMKHLLKSGCQATRDQVYLVF